jgi:hypothetical protein
MWIELISASGTSGRARSDLGKEPLTELCYTGGFAGV